jgi:hypothetical protein
MMKGPRVQGKSKKSLEGYFSLGGKNLYHRKQDSGNKNRKKNSMANILFDQDKPKPV